MVTRLQGTISQIKSRVNASGDAVNTVSLEVFGKVEELHAFLKLPLKISLEVEEEKEP